jgi:hypothetical protein
VNGSTFEDSIIEVTTSVTNDGTQPVSIGIRHLLDFFIGGDDGPTFQELGPAGPVRTTEVEFVEPSFAQYEITDNDVNVGAPTFSVFGSVSAPASNIPPPTVPDILQYVCWEKAFYSAFDYAPSNAEVATDDISCDTTNTGGDSAVSYYFGSTPATALIIQPGQTRTVTTLVFSAPANASLPPAFGGPSPCGQTLTATVGNPLSFNLEASDPNEDTVTLSAVDIPPDATFTSTPGNPATGAFTWIPGPGDAGQTHSTTFSASDGSLTASCSVSVTVGSITQTPTVTPTAPPPTPTPTPSPPPPTLTLTPTVTPLPPTPPPSGPAACRGAGFFGTHGGTEKSGSKNIAQALLDDFNAVKETLTICGRTITNTDIGSVHSALEAICVSPKGNGRLQLARQLMTTALNCILTNSDDAVCPGGGQVAGVCSGVSVEEVFSACNSACASGQTTANVGPSAVSCISALDCFNNGGVFDLSTGECGEAVGQSCLARDLDNGCFHLQPPGPAGSPRACNQARKNDITILP